MPNLNKARDVGIQERRFMNITEPYTEEENESH